MCQRLKCDEGSLELCAEWSGAGVWGLMESKDGRKAMWEVGWRQTVEVFTGVVERCLYLTLEKEGSF